MDKEFKEKYDKYKRIVRIWEFEFKKEFSRIPSKHDIRDAPYNVRQAYKMYYKMKTSFLEQTLTDILNDGDDEDENNCDNNDKSSEPMSSSDFLEMSQLASSQSMDISISDSIHELIDPSKKLPLLDENEHAMASNNKEFEAHGHVATNDNAWNSNLNKPIAKLTSAKSENLPSTSSSIDNIYKTTKKPKVQLNFDKMVYFKPPRNPRIPLSKTKSSQQSDTSGSDNLNDSLPDLETILLEKSRSGKVVEIKKTEKPLETEIKTNIDSSWLDRNAPSTSSMNSNENVPSILSTTSSFGLSNLNLKSFTSTVTPLETCNIEAKYHSGDISDSEYIENQQEKREEILPVVKKRKLLNDQPVSSLSSENKLPPLRVEQDSVEVVIAPIKPKRRNARKVNITKVAASHHYNTDDDDFDNDDSDADPNFVEKEKEKSPVSIQSATSPSSPKVIKRKMSLIQRSKDGISKVTKKAAKILAPNRRNKRKIEDEDENVQPIEEEESINFLVDTELNSIKNVPRVSAKELNANEQIFGNFIHQDIGKVNTIEQIVDFKTATKKQALEKKMQAGTLNENFVRVNLKKKVFVRGKKAFNFSRYKKTLWKSKKNAVSLLEDTRGCDGGVLKCHSCGGVGHFARQCKKKGDALLPIEADNEENTSTLPTLQEAAHMANQQKLLVHSSNPQSLPSTSNQIWNDNKNEEYDDEISAVELLEQYNKENEIINANSLIETVNEKKTYIGHKIPDEFLKDSGLLESSVGNKDKIEPYLKLNADGSVPSQIPKEVLHALKLFGHKSFRNGQDSAIMRILCGLSTLVTLSTGSGKSLCYQLPAYLYRQKYHCITLVVSPLVSLMEDQVHGIPDFINAQCLHTNQTLKQREKIMEEIRTGKVEILLVSPEAVVSGEKSTGFGSLLRQLPPIAFACIDETHCVSQWSHNFRPSYLMICRVLREKLGVKTILGLTATATLQTRNSIVEHLAIPDKLDGIISDTPMPDNLILTISKDENRDKALIALLRSERFESLDSIIIYCTRRDECERISGFLRTGLQDTAKVQQTSKKRKRANLVAECYHAGLPASRRRSIQKSFMSGELRIVVSTVAFGMGVNKSDIRGIIHYNMPASFESFVQEVGRAGRDGKIAHCHAFLDSRGGDLSELRRHIFSNSIDRHAIRKLLKKVFIPCSCKQRIESKGEEKMEVDQARVCPGHEVCFSIEQTVQALDVPEENIMTMLCYLELHEDRYIKVLGNAYTMCKIISYSGPNYMKQMAKTCPPLAMAIALHLKEGKKQEDLGSIEFCVVDVASAIGWDSGVVKYQLKQLEWSITNGSKKRSPLTVSFSDLGFRIRSPGDLSDDELDRALDSLENRTASQEKTQLVQLQLIFDTFMSLSFPNYTKCSTNDVSFKESNELKTIIREYFQTKLIMDVEITEQNDTTTDEDIVHDIRQMTHMYPENNFSGRSLARIFHGISSPCFPAVIWGRCKYWRKHLSVDFHRLVRIGNREIVNLRLN